MIGRKDGKFKFVEGREQCFKGLWAKLFKRRLSKWFGRVVELKWDGLL